MTKEEFIEKMAKKFAHENYTILKFGKNTYENSIIKCNTCGRQIIVNTGELFRTRRKNICSKCNYKRKDTARNEEIVIKALKEHSTLNFIEFYFVRKKSGIRWHYVRYLCEKCGNTTEQAVADFLRREGPLNCNFCSGAKGQKNTSVFRQELEQLYPGKFILLNEYIDAKTDVKVRCRDCGFIRKVKPTAIIRSGLCPKCGKRNSKGEEKIINYLLEKNIKFETQKHFPEFNINQSRYDFYIPEHHLLIEFMGIQHYYFNEFFHKTQEGWEDQLRRDAAKKKVALSNGYNLLVISYLEIENISNIFNILFSSTTISQESRGKYLEAKAILESR